MDRLFEALRRNPDAIAIAVLCLVLGVGRQMPRAHATVFQTAPPAAAEWIWDEHGAAAFRSHWMDCLRDLPRALPSDGAAR